MGIVAVYIMVENSQIQFFFILSQFYEELNDSKPFLLHNFVFIKLKPILTCKG